MNELIDNVDAVEAFGNLGREIRMVPNENILPCAEATKRGRS